MSRAEFDFAFSTRVRYADIDMQGIMFNGAYLAYFDTAITEFFRARRVDLAAYAQETNCQFHVVRSLIEYKHPVVNDAEIDILTRIARAGVSSLTFNLEIHPKAEDLVMTAGEVVYVHTDRATKRSTPLTQRLRTSLLGAASRP
jgi:acyl-CoA thioester hydrolase